MNIKTMQVGPLGTNCYLLEDEHTHAAAVIDPGGDGARIEVFPPIGAPTVPYGDGDVVKLGDLDIQVLHTPGHTPGGVCLLVGDALFTGDTLFQGSMGRIDFGGGSYEDIMASLARLAHLPGDFRVLPGHMDASTLERERKTNYYIREALRG